MIIFLIAAYFIGVVVTQNIVSDYVSAYVGLSEKELIAKYGYPVEVHSVKTQDGYILRMFRIPHGKNNSHLERRPPVLLIAGLLTSSAAWVLMGPKNGIGFILADEGYDVWLADVRGTTWSRKHETLSPSRNKKKFWDFSIDEMASYDVPAFVDHVLNTTGRQKLLYIGHSQGTSIATALACTKPEYNNKFHLMILLAPAIYMGAVTQVLLRILGSYGKDIFNIMQTYRIYEIAPYTPILSVLSQVFCNDRSPFQVICAGIIGFMGGYSTHFNNTMIPIVGSHIPAGTSIKDLVHIGQVIASDIPRLFDYGTAENMIIYGQSEPPIYNVTKITAPIAMYYSDTDPISSVEGVNRLALEFPNVVQTKLVSGFSHIDFTWASDIVAMFFEDVIKLMKQYETS